MGHFQLISSYDLALALALRGAQYTTIHEVLQRAILIAFAFKPERLLQCFLQNVSDVRSLMFSSK